MAEKQQKEKSYQKERRGLSRALDLHEQGLLTTGMPGQPAATNESPPTSEDEVSLFERPPVEAPTSSQTKKSKCPDLSQEQHDGELFLVQQLVGKYDGHVPVRPGGGKIDDLWEESIIPKLYGADGPFSQYEQPTGVTAVSNLRKKFREWNAKKEKQYQAKKEKDAGYCASPAEYLAMEQISQREQKKIIIHENTKGRRKEKKDENYERHAKKMRLESDMGRPGPLKAVGFSYNKRPDGSTVDPSKLTPRHVDMIDGLDEETKKMGHLETKIDNLFSKLMEGSGEGSNSANAVVKQQQLGIINGLYLLKKRIQDVGDDTSQVDEDIKKEERKYGAMPD